MEPHSDTDSIFHVGVRGFEPPTSWSQTKRSSRAELHPELFQTLFINIQKIQVTCKTG
jgi:hypothetical protein